MTSQYDIEKGISDLKRLDFDIKKLQENKKPNSIEKKFIKTLEKKFIKDNNKIFEWCKEFDSRIKPLPALEICPKPDRVFVIRIPNQIKDEKREEHIREFSNFIKSQNYKSEGMDLQKGYITNVYSFFCKAYIETTTKSIEEHIKK